MLFDNYVKLKGQGPSCWMKAIYIGAYYWSQGPERIRASFLYMHTSKQPSEEPIKVGLWVFDRSYGDALGLGWIYFFAMHYLHVPTIGMMFVKTLLTPNLLAMSLYMENYSVSGVNICTLTHILIQQMEVLVM